MVRLDSWINVKQFEALRSSKNEKQVKNYKNASLGIDLNRINGLKSNFKLIMILRFLPEMKVSTNIKILFYICINHLALVNIETNSVIIC